MEMYLDAEVKWESYSRVKLSSSITLQTDSVTYGNCF